MDLETRDQSLAHNINKYETKHINKVLVSSINKTANNIEIAFSNSIVGFTFVLINKMSNLWP